MSGEHAKGRYRITGARIAPLGPSHDILEGMDVWIANGLIAAINPVDDTPQFQPGTYQTLPFSNALVLPGLINSHSHSTSALLKGKSPGAPLDLFVMEAMSRRAARGMEDIRTIILLHAIEMLKHGVTGIVDHFRHNAIPSAEAIATVFNAYEEAGVRAVVAPMFEDKRYIESMPIEPARLPADVQERWRTKKPPAAQDYFAMMEEVADETRDSGRVKLMLGVDGPQRCTTGLLEMAGDFAARHDVGLHTHLLEAKTQALMAPPEFGGSFVAYLDHFGLIGPKSSLAHFVWGTDRDIELAAETRVNVVNNPMSNLLLGSGLQPTARLLEAGVSVGIGSDGCAGHSMNLFEQARLSMLLSRISQPDCDRWMTAPQALRLATTGGAAVLGEPGKLGVVDVGAHADLMILDLNTRVYKPMGDIWNHLVMFETGESVDTVFVAGEICLSGGRCTRFNEEDVYDAAAELAARSNVDSVQSLTVTHGERCAFQPLITEALGRDLDINRFASLT